MIYTIVLMSMMIVLQLPAITEEKRDRTVFYYSPVRLNGEHYLKKIIGRYGEFRSSGKYGHLHAGIDIKGDYCQNVYATGNGVVVKIYRKFPDKTIYIRHSGYENKPIYSVYMHIEDIRVETGEKVTENTIIGRIFNRQELEDSEFNTSPHLHLEIRHDISDEGRATFECMTKKELDKYCINPLDVLLNKRRE